MHVYERTGLVVGKKGKFRVFIFIVTGTAAIIQRSGLLIPRHFQGVQGAVGTADLKFEEHDAGSTVMSFVIRGPVTSPPTPSILISKVAPVIPTF